MSPYVSLESGTRLRRRAFLSLGSRTLLGASLLWEASRLWPQESQKQQIPARPQTNLADALKIPKTRLSLPGPYPGRVVEVHDERTWRQGAAHPAPACVRAMVEKGITTLTGKNLRKSFKLLFSTADRVGIKVNPVGAGLISTRLEVVDAVIAWLLDNGLKRERIIIWDRFDYMLRDAGFTPERYPGIGIEGLQTMDEAAAEGKTQDDSRWLDPNGHHVSENNFDPAAYYYVDVEGPKDKAYLNQHVFNGKFSYFGKLLTRKLSKIINIPVFKNTGNGISMATKNLGYGAICNTNRLHRPLFFDVCTEVLAFPAIRDKLVLNVTDGLRAQYDGGPEPLAQATYLYQTLFFATDPFALDSACHRLLVEKRKAMGVRVNEHPMYSEYLRYGERLGLGLADPQKITHIRV